MKKTGKDFRMSKQTKVMLALSKFKDAQSRGNFKRAMIDAQSTAQSASRTMQKGSNDGE